MLNIDFLSAYIAGSRFYNNNSFVCLSIQVLFDQSLSGLDLNAAVGLTSYSGDELWRTHGPQTLQEAYSFVGRVVKFAAENKITEGKAVQQILIKTARDDLRKKGVVEFECSESETSEAEPQGKVDTRTKKRKRSSNEEPRPNTTSNRGGSSRGTSKKHFPTQKRGQNKSRAVSSGDHPPPSKRSRWGSSNRARGHQNPFYRRERSPPRTLRCRHCRS